MRLVVPEAQDLNTKTMMDTHIGKIDNVEYILLFVVHPGELGKFNNFKQSTIIFHSKKLPTFLFFILKFKILKYFQVINSI